MCGATYDFMHLSLDFDLMYKTEKFVKISPTTIRPTNKDICNVVFSIYDLIPSVVE